MSQPTPGFASPTRPRLSAETRRILDSYAAQTLACSPEPAHQGGVHVLAEPRRGLPHWKDFTLPILGLAYSGGAIVTVRPDWLQPLLAELGSDVRLASLDLAALNRLERATRRVARHAFILNGVFRAVDRQLFQPASTEGIAELIPKDDAAALHLRPRFDGEIFGVRGPRNRLVSWAAIKLKSDLAWEIAVATEPDSRGRGYARAVVSAATRHILDAGRLALYLHDRENRTSAFVARSLGYQPYADVVFAEY